MFDPRTMLCDASAWEHYRYQQKLALAGKIDIFDLTTVVVADNAGFIIRNQRKLATLYEALRAFGCGLPPKDDIDFMGTILAANFLVPTADPRNARAPWPTVVIPADEHNYPFVETGDDEHRMLDVLSDWRTRVDEFASAIPCYPLGWVGGIWVRHPRAEKRSKEKAMLWPWLHPPYTPEARPGDARLFELFNVSINAASR